MPHSITPAELEKLHRTGKPIELIDVRTPPEYRQLHVEFARSVPLDRLNASALAAERRQSGDAPMYFICQRGSRGKRACDALAAAGCANIVNVDGGTLACETAGLPMVRGKPAMSLERQVRIAAGGLVGIGSALALFVHPYWMALPAVIGAGLVLAGITDNCGMAMVLARMPWNQIGEPTPTCRKSSS
jgi:rhodanese-related sulfurtransferase